MLLKFHRWFKYIYEHWAAAFEAERVINTGFSNKHLNKRNSRSFKEVLCFGKLKSCIHAVVCFWFVCPFHCFNTARWLVGTDCRQVNIFYANYDNCSNLLATRAITRRFLVKHSRRLVSPKNKKQLPAATHQPVEGSTFVPSGCGGVTNRALGLYDFEVSDGARVTFRPEHS